MRVNINVNERMFENILVILLLLVIACFLMPIVFNVIYNSQKSGAEASVYGNITSIELLYEKESQTGKANLPFIVEYKDDSYNIYVNGRIYKASNKIETKGNRPTSGSIIIMPDGLTTVVSLKLNGYICSKPVNGELDCERSS